MFALCLSFGVTAPLLVLAVLHLQIRLAVRCRERLKPQAERLLIESRWMERHAKSPAEFRSRWDAELARLHNLQTSKAMRAIFWIGSFRQALHAECAAILTKEIESWTFVDRSSSSPESYERLMLRCLRTSGWRLNDRDGEHVVLTRERSSIVGRLLWTAHDIECLAISEAAAAASRIGCPNVCVITNGRFTGAAAAMARQLNVALLHCSQLDLLPALAAAPVSVRSSRTTDLRMVA